MILHLRSSDVVQPGESVTLSTAAPPGYRALMLDPPPAARARMARFALINVAVGGVVEGGDLQFLVEVKNVGSVAAVAELDVLDREELVDTVGGYRRRDEPPFSPHADRGPGFTHHGTPAECGCYQRTPGGDQ